MRKRQKRSQKDILHDNAWNTFSKWIRNRDKKCVTCGSTTTLQAGHYWHGKLDFDEININTQCAGCNHFKSGNLAVYGEYLVKKYGSKGFNQLTKRKNLASAGEYRTEKDYEDIINKYKLQ